MKGWGEPRGHTRGGLAAVPRRGCRGGGCDQLMKEVVKGWGEPRGHTRGGLAAVPRRGGEGGGVSPGVTQGEDWQLYPGGGVGGGGVIS